MKRKLFIFIVLIFISSVSAFSMGHSSKHGYNGGYNSGQNDHPTPGQKDHPFPGGGGTPEPSTIALIIGGVGAALAVKKFKK